MDDPPKRDRWKHTVRVAPGGVAAPVEAGWRCCLCGAKILPSVKMADHLPLCTEYEHVSIEQTKARKY